MRDKLPAGARRYRIRRRDEETECDYCGVPCEVGDSMIEVDDYARVYCSRTCTLKGEQPVELDNN